MVPPTVYNAEEDLARSVRRLHAFLRDQFQLSARITIADNASTDGTRALAGRLAAELPEVRLLHLSEKGRGRAVAAEAVMAIGGFNGTDPVPSLARFEKLVAEGKIHYFIGGGRGGNLASRAGSSEISDWVSRHFTAKTVGGTTVYDLTQPAN